MQLPDDAPSEGSTREHAPVDININTRVKHSSTPAQAVNKFESFLKRFETNIAEHRFGSPARLHPLHTPETKIHLSADLSRRKELKVPIMTKAEIAINTHISPIHLIVSGRGGGIGISTATRHPAQAKKKKRGIESLASVLVETN